MVELVPAICPKCGANLQLPNNLEKAHCVYCGTEIIIEIKKPDIHYHGVGDVKTYLELANIALKGENYSDAVENYTKALQIDSNNEEAWLGKARALDNYKEAIACCDKAIAINLSGQGKELNEVCIQKHINNTLIKVQIILSEMAETKWNVEKIELTKPIPSLDLGIRMNRIKNSITDRYTSEALNVINELLKYEQAQKNALVWKQKGDILIIWRAGLPRNSQLRAEGDLCYQKAKELDPTIEIPKTPETHGCFIATAAYGTPMAEEINVLRQWRDETLMNTISGRALVKIYYTISPPIAGFISTSERLKATTRILLNPFVHFARVTA